MEHRYIPLDVSYLEEMLALQRECWAFDRGIFVLSSRALLERAFQFRNYAFGAFSGDQMAGFVTFSLPSHRSRMNLGRHFNFSDDLLDRVAHANTMMIAPKSRRQGIGGRLFNLAMSALPDNVDYVMTTTKFENALARCLLESRGFRHEKTVEASCGTRAIYVLDRTGAAEPTALEALGTHADPTEVGN